MIDVVIINDLKAFCKFCYFKAKMNHLKASL